MDFLARIKPRQDVAIGWRLLDGVIWLWQRVRIQRLRSATGYVLVLPGILFVGVLAIGVAALCWKSFHSYNAFLDTQGGLTTSNYRSLAGIHYLPGVVYRTVAISAVAAVISIGLGLPLAYTMIRTRSRGIRFVLLWILFLPLLTGEIVRAYGWVALLSGGGLVPWLAHELGFGRVDLLGTPWAVAAGIIQWTLPLATLLLFPAIHTIDPEIEAAASSLGARPWRAWLHVMLPLLRRGLAAAAALCFTLSVSSYAMPQLLGVGLQDFVGNVIYDIIFSGNDLYTGSALAFCVLVGATICVVLILSLGRGSGGRLRRRRTSSTYEKEAPPKEPVYEGGSP